jgi:hypothetical protein
MCDTGTGQQVAQLLDSYTMMMMMMMAMMSFGLCDYRLL